MENSTDSAWPIVRIGISPYGRSVSACVLDPNPNACKRQGGVGIELDILLIILNLLKLQPKFILSKDLQCGDVRVFNQTDYRATGLFNMLLHHEIDVTGNICGLTKSRLLLTDMSYPVYYSRQVFVLKKPIAAYNFDIWAPLSVHVWISYVVLVLVQGIMMGLAKIGMTYPRWKYSLSKFSVRIDYLCDATIGCFCVMYSSYVLISLMFPKAKPIPFNSGTELSFLIENGQYRLVDFHDPPRPPEPINNITEARFSAGVAKYGYVIAGSTINGIYASLVKDSKLIATRSDTWTYQDFNDYPEHDQLAVVDDADIRSIWKGYFWNRKFRYNNDIDYFLSISSGMVERVRLRNLPNANRRDLTQTGNEQLISLNLFTNLFTMYAGSLMIAILIAFIECIMPKMVVKKYSMETCGETE